MAGSAEKLRQWLQASALGRPVYFALRAAKRFLKDLSAFVKSGFFVAGTVLPVWVQTGKRPVLFSRRLGAGDIICTFPAVELLKARHAGATCFYNCVPEFFSLPLLAGAASRSVFTDVPALKRFWPYCFSAIYQFEWGGDGKNYYVSDEFPIEAFCLQHGLPPTRHHPFLKVPDSLTLAAAQRLDKKLDPEGGPLIVFHTGPTWLIREWPQESWTKLIARLQAAGFKNLVQVGASKNAFLGDIKGDPIPGVISLVDELSLVETIGVISKAKLLIGIDSGLLHMAAWVRTPFVGIWGPTTPQLRFSETCRHTPVVSSVPCQGCHHRLPCLHWISGCKNDIACMKEISVDRVFAACQHELQAKSDRAGEASVSCADVA